MRSLSLPRVLGRMRVLMLWGDCIRPWEKIICRPQTWFGLLRCCLLRLPLTRTQASIQSALLGRVYDTHPGVLQALYGSHELFLSVVIPSTSPQKLLEVIISQLQPTPPARAVLHAHTAFLSGTLVKTYPECSSVVQQHALFPFLLASKAKFKTTRGVWAAIKENGGFQTGWLRGCEDIWDRASLLMENEEEDREKSPDKICEANLGIAGKIAGQFQSPRLLLRTRLDDCFIFQRTSSRPTTLITKLVSCCLSCTIHCHMLGPSRILFAVPFWSALLVISKFPWLVIY